VPGAAATRPDNSKKRRPGRQPPQLATMITKEKFPIRTLFFRDHEKAF
jgi:hypothetical protein